MKKAGRGLIVLRGRASLAQRARWAFLDGRVDQIAKMNRRQVPEYRGVAHYDARGYLERYPEIYNVGRRGFWSEGHFIKAIAGGAWSPPIGIPDPGWGIDTPTMPALPSPWDSDTTSGFYYVKAGGSNPNNGRPGSPRGTIPSPIPAGAVVVMDNTATFTLPTRITSNGSSGSPAFLVGSSLSSSNRAQLDCNGDAGFDGTYLVVEYVHFRPVSGGSHFVGLDGNVDHFAYRHCEISGTISQPTHAAIQLTSYTGTRTRTNVIIYDVSAHDLNDWQATTDIDAHAVKVDTISSNVWVLDSLFNKICGDSVQIGPQDPEYTNCHHCYMGRCVSSQNRQSGGWAKGARDVVFSQNTSSNHPGFGSASPGNAFGMQAGGDRIWFIYNHAFGTMGHAAMTFLQNLNLSGEGVELYAIGNVIHDLSSGGSFDDNHGIRLRAQDTDIIVMNNTLYGMRRGIVKSVSGSGERYVWNNIIDNITNESGSAHIEWDNAGSNSDVLRNNLFGLGSTNFKVTQWPPSGTYTNLATWEASASSRLSGNQNADPTYVNVAAPPGGFALTEASNGVDDGGTPGSSGFTPDPYARFASLYGLSLAVDFDGGSRPQNGSWDAGAFEFGDEAPPAAPNRVISRISRPMVMR